MEIILTYAPKRRTQHQTTVNLMSFKKVQAKIAKSEGVTMKNAGAILASASRNASEKVKEANPKLRRVK